MGPGCAMRGSRVSLRGTLARSHHNLHSSIGSFGSGQNIQKKLKSYEDMRGDLAAQRALNREMRKRG
jgi:hypothetical protein